MKKGMSTQEEIAEAFEILKKAGIPLNRYNLALPYSSPVSPSEPEGENDPQYVKRVDYKAVWSLTSR